MCAALVLAAAGAVGGASTATAGTASPAAAYQQSPTHDGASPDRVLTPPLARRWQLDLGGTVSYPVLANGLAYVTVQNAGAYGTKLYALDPATGATVWGPVDLGGTFNFSGIAYDAGQVFALNWNGILRAFDAASGAPLWSRQLIGQSSFTSPPTAANGLVYTGGAGSGGTVYAVHESDGTIAWTASVENGDHSSPAVTPTGVYVSYACDQAYDFDPASGALIWHHDAPCEGGGGKTVALHDGRVYTRDFFQGNLILDANTGALLGSYSATVIPAFDGAMGFFLNGSTLSATDEAGTIHWTFSGDGSLDSAPIVDNGFVYIGSNSGNLYALAESTGAVVWTTNVGAPIQQPDEQNFRVLTGMAAADGKLLVAAGETLTAFDSAEPSIVASASGTQGSNGWFTSRVVVHFTCTAGSSNTVTECPADVTLNKQGGGQVVSGTVVDSAGQSASTSISVNIDRSAPAVAVTSSSDTVNAAVQGNAVDRVSGVGDVTVTFTSLSGSATEQATLAPCPNGDPACVVWSAPPPTGLLGTGIGAGGATVWTGTVTATATDVAGLSSTTSPSSQTLVG